jgi:predicted Rossmann fold flavoprotein
MIHHYKDSSAVDLLIIGGGAAGYFAAIASVETAAKQRGKLPKVLIIEKAGKPLGKVLISGGGRCNVTHACFDPVRLVENYPRGGPALRSLFARFQPKDTIAWFEQHGVRLKTEADGRIFPTTDQSETVVRCLMDTAKHFGVQLLTQTRVEAIERQDETGDSFTVRLKRQKDGKTETLRSQRILLATGGDPGGQALARSLGHTIIPPVPSLFTFTIRDDRLSGLAGVTIQSARVKLLSNESQRSQPLGFEQEGPVLITHWGLSGPAVLRLSAWGARWLFDRQYRSNLEVNWLGSQSQDATLEELLAYKQNRARASQKAMNHPPFPGLPIRLWKRLTAAAGIAEEYNWGDLSKTALQRLTDELTRGQYQVQGKGAFKEEFVTCGGIPLDEVNLRTMESKLLPGIYFAGEVLNVDGLTGGFNFQNAWTTAWIAGETIAAL